MAGFSLLHRWFAQMSPGDYLEPNEGHELNSAPDEIVLTLYTAGRLASPRSDYRTAVLAKVGNALSIAVWRSGADHLRRALRHRVGGSAGRGSVRRPARRGMASAGAEEQRRLPQAAQRTRP